MPDIATPNLPSRDFEVTSCFYRELGFEEAWRDEGWMILKRGELLLEFFHHPELDPATTAFGSCLRMGDIKPLYDAALVAGVPEAPTGWPRLHRPRGEDWGGVVGAIIDPDCNLLRLIEVPS